MNSGGGKRDGAVRVDSKVGRISPGKLKFEGGMTGGRGGWKSRVGVSERSESALSVETSGD